MKVDLKIKNKISKKIGNTIKFYRSKNNISQENLAHDIGVDRTYISALENGTKCASIYCLYLLAEKLNVQIKDLVDINII